MSDDQSPFAANLRRARQARGLSLRPLRERINGAVSHAALHKYETGASWPSSSVLVALGRALGVGLDCLMAGEVCAVLGDVGALRRAVRALEEAERTQAPGAYEDARAAVVSAARALAHAAEEPAP